MTLEPQIVAKLEAFARRRRKLIIVRGVCTAVALLLATMMVVALVDWLFVLPDAVRWTMSATAYLAVLLAEWRTCLRLLAHAPGPRRLARLIEHAEPRLREDLLSAVELGTANETEIFDSTRFRELVQSDVASRVAGIDVDRLLPVQLVRRYLTVAAVIVAALLLAFALTGMQAGTLLIRAFLPMANLARVSQYKVAILQPADPEPVVPHGELVSIVIQVSGGKTNKAILETFSVHGGREVLPMTPLGADRFSATIQVAREDVRYRIRAGDAITRKFQLDAEPRPHVAEFHKRYIYPDYVRKPPKEVSEENGDLVALEGSAVEIGVETSLPVKSGELRIEQGPKSEIIPLIVTATKPGEPTTRLSAKIPLHASGSYRVHLVAARTAFENKFSPEYEIRVDPDLVPQVELELPERDLIAPANEIIDLQATATDDQSLAGVSQFVRINEEDWKETILATDPADRIKIERRWDIFEEGVKPGDLLAFKLQATDSKGNKAESRSLQITVTQSGFELTRLGALEMQRKVHETLRQLRVAGETLGKQASELGNQFPQLGENDPRRQQLISMTVSAQTGFEQVAAEAWKALRSAIPVSSAGHVAAELVLTGRMLARTNQGSANAARDILDILQANPDAANARDDAREYAGAAGRLVGRAALVEQTYRIFLAAEELDVANEIINVLGAEHERLATLADNSGIDQERWRPLLKRLRVVTAECRTLEKLLSTAGPHMTGGYADRMRRLQRKMEQSRALLDEAVKRAESEKLASDAFGKLSKTAQQTARDLLALRRDLLVMKREMLPEAVQAVNHLFAEVQPTHTNLDKLQQDLRMNARNEKLPGEARAMLESRRWETRIALVKAHGDLEEPRPVSDSHFVNDLRSVTLALHALHAASGELGLDRVDEKLSALEKPLRLLENAHNISELADGAQHLLAAERWELFSPQARTANPRDWEWIEGRMKVVAEELGNTGLEPPARELLREAQKRVREAIADPAARAVNEEMKQRLHPEREPRAVPDDVEHVALLLQQALDILRKPMDEARAELAAATPRLEKVMAQLARESETLKEETSAQAARTKEQPLDQAQAAAEQMLARQESLNEKVETLKDALRSEANKRDILDPLAREVARDVDDALALLKDPPQRAATALEEAAQTALAEARQNHLQTAAVEQQKLADSLQQLSEHFAHAEQPNAQQTRTALRDTESMTGVKEKLDAQYARAEQLAQMARSSPQELLAQLEKALPENPVMQRELDSISENLLTSARQQLAQASQKEKQVADNVGKLAAEQQAQIDALSFQTSPPVPSSQPPAPSGNPAPSNPAAPQNPPLAPPAGGSPEPTNAPPAPANGSVPPPSPARSAQLAQAAAQQAPIAAQTNRAGEEVSRAGRHEMRLNNTTAGGKLEQLGHEIRETAKTEVPAAAKALGGSSAVQAAPAVSVANAELARELEALQAAAAAGQESADPSQRGSAAEPSSPAPPSPSTNPPASGHPPGTSAQSPPAAPAQKGAPNAPSPGAPGAPHEDAAPQPGSPGGTGTPQGTPSQFAATPATQQEQMWMARTLDALDAMLNATPSSSQASASQNEEQLGSPAGSPPPGSSAVSQAMSAMNAAGRSAAAAMRGPGLGDGPGEQPRSEDKIKSTAGAQIAGKHLPYAALPGAKEGKTADWGKLPKKVAEELSQGQRETVAGEYRNQVETYYRVIAEKSRQ